MNAACENDAYVHVSKFVDCLAFAEAERIVREFPLMYRQSRDSIWLFAEHLSHSQMLFALSQEYVYIERSHRFRMPHSCSVRVRVLLAFAFCSRSDVNAALVR